MVSVVGILHDLFCLYAKEKEGQLFGGVLSIIVESITIVMGELRR